MDAIPELRIPAMLNHGDFVIVRNGVAERNQAIVLCGLKLVMGVITRYVTSKPKIVFFECG